MNLYTLENGCMPYLECLSRHSRYIGPNRGWLECLPDSARLIGIYSRVVAVMKNDTLCIILDKKNQIKMLPRALGVSVFWGYWVGWFGCFLSETF